MSPQKAVFEAVFCRKWLLTAKPSTFDYIVLYIVGKLWISAFSWYFWKNISWILQSVRISWTHPDWSVTISLKPVIGQQNVGKIWAMLLSVPEVPKYRWIQHIYFTKQMRTEKKIITVERLKWTAFVFVFDNICTRSQGSSTGLDSSRPQLPGPIDWEEQYWRGRTRKRCCRTCKELISAR